MGRFDVKTELVVIDGDEYKLEPLSGEFLPLIYSVMKSINPDGKKNLTEEELSKNLTDDAISKMHKVCLETLKASYPTEDANKLDKFVSNNLWVLYPAAIKVNLSTEE